MVVILPNYRSHTTQGHPVYVEYSDTGRLHSSKLRKGIEFKIPAGWDEIDIQINPLEITLLFM